MATSRFACNLPALKRLAQWKSAAQFNFESGGGPVKNDVEVVGTGDDAFVRLTGTPSDEDVPFTTPGNYDYDPAKIEVTGGKAKLKAISGGVGDDDFPYTTPANYTYDSNKIEVVGGKAQLKNKMLDGQHAWPYTTIGNYSVSPVSSIDIIAGKAQLHDQGSSTDEDDVDYNTPGSYTYDSGKVEFIDKGGGNFAATLKGGGVDPNAWWHLNEASGSNASDSSTHGRNGTLVNMEDGDWGPAKLNNGLTFDGVDEYVDCGQAGNWDSDEPFSIEFWSYNPSYTRLQTLIAKESRVAPAIPGWLVYMDNTGRINFYLISNNGTGNLLAVEGPTQIWDPVWFHVVITYDGSSTAAGVHIYINNVDQTNVVLDDNLTGSILTPTTCQIGAADAQLHYEGSFDEVVLYDEELDASQVAYRYNAGSGTESMPGGFAIDNPTVVQDFDAGFGTIFQWKDYIETKTAAAGSEVKYNLSTDSGVTWQYWTGAAWATADGTYAQSNTGTEVDANFPALGVGTETLRIKAFLHSDDGSVAPELDNVNFDWYEALHDYITDGRITTLVELDESPDEMHSWEAFAETVEEPASTEVRYVLSNNSGVTWLYYSGGWIASDGLTWAQFGTGADTVAHIGTFPTTNPTMLLRAYLKTTDTEVTPKLNNVQVDYKHGFDYDTGSPAIEADFDIGPGASPLLNWRDFVETATIPGSTLITYVISDDSGVTWYWWNSAWVVSDSSLAQSNVAADIDTNLDTFSTGTKTLRVKALLTTVDSEVRPELDNVNVQWVETAVTYPTTPEEVAMDYDLQPAQVGSWDEVDETVVKPANTTILYQYSIDAGVSWSGSWLTEAELTTAVAQLSTVGDGTDTLRLKAQLQTTDAGATPELDNLNVEFTAGFATSGSYESIKYIPADVYVGEIDFDLTLPGGATIVVKARVVDHAIEEGYFTVTDGELLDRVGTFIQWKATLTGDGTTSPRVNSVEIEFGTGF